MVEIPSPAFGVRRVEVAEVKEARTQLPNPHMGPCVGNEALTAGDLVGRDVQNRGAGSHNLHLMSLTVSTPRVVESTSAESRQCSFLHKRQAGPPYRYFICPLSHL